MDSSKKKPTTIDAYISAYPKAVQEILETIRLTIKQAVPQAEEGISYGMPTFRVNGSSFIHIAANKHHIGLYPSPSPSDEAFRAELAAYQGTKSSLHFPLNKPLPLDLLAQIAKQRVEEISRK